MTVLLIIAHEYAKKDKRIKVIHKKNGGLVSARKSGLKIASGEYISNIDSDDFLETEMYEVYVNTLNNTDADIIIGGYKEDLANNSSEILLNRILSGLYIGEDLLNKIYPKMIYTGAFSEFGISTYMWNKIFKKNLIFDVQMQVDERISLGEDACVTYPALLKAKKICIIDSCLYHYVQHTESMMKSKLNIKKDYERIHVLYNYLKEVFSEAEFKDILLPQLEMYILSLSSVFISGIKKSKDYVSPYKNILPRARVVLCGAGSLGQHLYKRFIETNECNVVSWVDINFVKYQRINLPVKSIDSLLNTEYDYIINAYVDINNATRMKSILKNFGIDDKKIIWFDYDFSNTKQMLKNYNLG